MSDFILGNSFSTLCFIMSFVFFFLSIKLKKQNTDKSRRKSQTQDLEIKKQGYIFNFYN